MTKRRLVRWPLALLAPLSMAAACGSDPSPDASSAVGGASGAAGAAATSAAAGAGAGAAGRPDACHPEVNEDSSWAVASWLSLERPMLWAPADGGFYTYGMTPPLSDRFAFVDPQQKQWTTKADPFAQKGFVQLGGGPAFAVRSAVAGTSVFFVGRIADVADRAAIEAFPNADSPPLVWPDPPVTRLQAGAFVHQERLYLVGGRADLDASDRVFSLDLTNGPAAATWREEAPLPGPRSDFAGVLVGDAYWLVGGVTAWTSGGPDGVNYDKAVLAETDTLLEWRLSDKTWVKHPSLPTPRAKLSVAFDCGALLVAGGRGLPYVDIDVIEWFDIASGTWTSPLPKLRAARSVFPFGVFDGVAYAIGGDSRGTILNFPIKSIETLRLR